MELLCLCLMSFVLSETPDVFLKNIKNEKEIFLSICVKSLFGGFCQLWRTITTRPVQSQCWRLLSIFSIRFVCCCIHVAEFIHSKQLMEMHQIHILTFLRTECFFAMLSEHVLTEPNNSNETSRWFPAVFVLITDVLLRTSDVFMIARS